MEQQTEATMLQRHGTTLCRLPPTAIRHTAKTDIKRRKRNIKRGLTGERGYERYAFLAKHVRAASGAVELIERALSELGVGRASGKLNTRYLYGDEDGLRDALLITER